MSSTLGVAAFVALFLAAILFLVHVVRHGRRLLAEEQAALSAVSATHDWRLQRLPCQTAGFLLSGVASDGIAWQLRREPSSASGTDSDTPSASWSTDRVQWPAPFLALQPRAAHGRLQGSAALALADQLYRHVKPGASPLPLKKLYDDGQEWSLGDPGLATRFAVVTTDAGLAARLFTPEVLQSLKDWPRPTVVADLGPRIVVRPVHAPLDRGAIERTVELGLALARAALRAGA